jgi:hypothetical protein
MLTSISRSLSSSLLACALFACGDDPNPTESAAEGGERAASAAGSGKAAMQGVEPEPDAAAADPFAACDPGVIESDFQERTLRGSDAPEGTLPVGQYIISTTYLALRQDGAAQARFGQLMEPIRADLATRQGLLAYSLGSSRSCGAARTLAVWRDDIAMIGFVTGPAHGPAAASVTEVSRGGSLVTHWQGDEASANWAAAAEHAGAYDGPRY